MLRPVYPGQMNLIRRNLNSVVFVLDFSEPSALMLLSENIRQFVSRGIPLRFGVVPQVDSIAPENDVSAKVAQVLWYVVDAVGRVPAMTLLGDVSLFFLHLRTCELTIPLSQLALSGNLVSEPILSRLYEQLAMQSVHISGGPLATFDEVIKGVDVEATAFNSRLSKARAYIKRLAVEREPKSLGSFFLDGAHFKLDDVCCACLSDPYCR
jgi:UDP-glucose:glycoprotein glucosyltransferase